MLYKEIEFGYFCDVVNCTHLWALALFNVHKFQPQSLILYQMSIFFSLISRKYMT